MSRAAYIAGDWGTSRLRLYLCDTANNVLATREARGAAAARGEHERVLDAEIGAWGAEAAGLPVVLCGMVGSSIGWVQVPYLPAPADPRALAAACVAVRGGRVRIVPGVSCRNRLGAPDVMRGEETQILGALGLVPTLRQGTHLLCLPGTHAKWVVVREGAIHEFLTSPTGEFFDLLNRHSVLVGDGSTPGRVSDAGFEAGLARVRAQPGVELLHRVFEVRSRRLLGELAGEDAPGFMSGLLVGSDVAGAIRLYASEYARVHVVAAPELAQAYLLALRGLGHDAVIIDGAAAVLAGLGEIQRLAPQGGARHAAV